MKCLCFLNDGESLVLSSTGTGAMEAVISSMFGPGEKVVSVNGGKFGKRWGVLAQKFDLKVDEIVVDWGKSLEPETLIENTTDQTRAVLIQGCETSTGVFYPIREIGNALHQKYGDQRPLLIVDAITAMGVHDLRMDEQYIDVLIGGSQKALMSPPGGSVILLSSRAIQKLNESKPRSYYFDLKKELASQVENKTMFTPAITIFQAMNEALDMIFEEGVENVFQRHRQLSQFARDKIRKLDLDLFNRDQDCAFGITSVLAPKNMDVGAWLKCLKKEHGVWLAGGQEEWAGKIFRIGHMGYYFQKDLEFCFEIIQNTLKDFR